VYLRARQIKADQLHEAKQLIPGLQARTMHLQQLFRQIEQIEVAFRGRARGPPHGPATDAAPMRRA